MANENIIISDSHTHEQLLVQLFMVNWRNQMFYNEYVQGWVASWQCPRKTGRQFFLSRSATKWTNLLNAENSKNFFFPSLQAAKDAVEIIAYPPPITRTDLRGS